MTHGLLLPPPVRPHRPEPRPAVFRLELPRPRPPRDPLFGRCLKDLLRGGLAILVLHFCLVQISVVRGHSMEPSLLDGDRLVVDRTAYALGDVARYDVVVLRYPLDPSVDFVKRIVGLPGDRVALREGILLLNGQPVAAEFLHIEDHQDMPELQVPEGQYFVLGDNRPISCDSREFGLVPAGNLKGKVRARFWPLARLSMF